MSCKTLVLFHKKSVTAVAKESSNSFQSNKN